MTVYNNMTPSGLRPAWAHSEKAFWWLRMGNPTLGRQLHKRRLMPAPRPFILDPLPDAYTLFSSGKGTPELGWNGPKQVGRERE